MHITPEQNKLLAKLADFILENEIWKHSLLNECEYNIRLFTMKTHIPYRRTIYYLNNAFKKLLGQQYFYEQTRLFGLIVISEPAKFRHKPKAKKIVREQTKPKRTRSDPRKPKSEFGRKYKEHFGQYASTTGKEYHKEYLYYRNHRTRFVGRRKAVSGKSTALLSLRYIICDMILKWHYPFHYYLYKVSKNEKVLGCLV